MNSVSSGDFIVNRDDLILITGANGFMGPRVVQSLLNLGFRNLRCFVRPTSDVTALDACRDSQNGARVEVMRGNLLSPSDCVEATKDATVIFHLAAGAARSRFPMHFSIRP